jgi:C4-dicarboxylate-specific signal transduction histidine kinase
MRATLALLVGIPALGFVFNLVLMARANQATRQTADRALAWSNHLRSMNEMHYWTDEFVRAVALAQEEPDQREEVEEIGDKLLESTRRSRALAANFSPGEVEEEDELAAALEQMVQVGRELARHPDPDAMGLLRSRVYAEVSDRIGERLWEESEGAVTTARAADESVRGVQSTGLRVAALTWLAALLISFFSVRHLRTSLRRLFDGARAIASGRLEHQVVIDESDELRDLAAAFNEMARRLRATMIDRGQLEELVKQRTAELAASSEQLQARLGELRQAQARIAQSERLAALGSIAAGVAHEINNPVAVLASNLHFLGEAIGRTPQAGAAHPEEIGEALRDAVSAANRVTAIVRDLRTFAHAQAGAHDLADVNRALELALSVAGGHIRHRTELLRQLGPVPKVLGNEGRLSQVFLNLIVNAAQAMPPERLDGNRVQIRSWAEGDEVWVEVADNGAGMPAEIQQRIFEPLFTTKPPGQGTGMGLAISKRLIEEGCGGKLTFTSTPGAGTTFHVRLKARPQEQQRAPSDPERPLGPAA